MDETRHGGDSYVPDEAEVGADAAEGLVSIMEAARILGVHVNTVRAWIEAGRMPAVERVVVSKRLFIPREKLQEARQVRCLVCGRAFTAKRPLQAKFCCAKHRDAWHVRRNPRET